MNTRKIQTEDIIRDLVELLATAYQRHSRSRLLPPSASAPPSTQVLDNTRQQSVNELTLTRQNKEFAACR
jgi:hypothetical protein